MRPITIAWSPGSVHRGAVAFDWGLVNRVVSPDGLRGAVEELVGKIVACGPAAIRLQKELMIAWRYADLRMAIGCGIDAFAAAYATGEPREGAMAFLEKRSPRFDSLLGGGRCPPSEPPPGMAPAQPALEP